MRFCLPVAGPLLFLGFPILASAQAAPSVNASASHFLAPVTTISKAVDEVNVAFTVTDHKGRFIDNLRPDDFHLLDNHLAPQRLTYFQQRSDLPLHVAVLIDASASVKYRFKFEQEAALAFVKKLLRPGTEKAFVVAFNDRVTTIQGLTENPSKISKALVKVNVDGNTSLYDAVIFAADQLGKIPERDITRRAIVLISDGVDTVNRATLQQAEQAAARNQATIFALSTNSSDLEPNANGDAVLKELAASTGGSLLPAHDGSRLFTAFRDVAKALHNQYVLAYNPMDFEADGSYRTIEIVPLKRGLRTNCRKGYYANVRATP